MAYYALLQLVLAGVVAMLIASLVPGLVSLARRRRHPWRDGAFRGRSRR